MERDIFGQCQIQDYNFDYLYSLDTISKEQIDKMECIISQSRCNGISSMPAMLDRLAYVLQDTMLSNGEINNKLASSLLNIFIIFWDVCCTVHNKYEDLIKYCKNAAVRHYETVTDEWRRTSTVQEVDEKIDQLIEVRRYPMGEAKYYWLQLYMWVETGGERYLKTAVETNETLSNVIASLDIVSIIRVVGPMLKDMAGWILGDNGEGWEGIAGDIENLKQAAVGAKFKYLEGAENEIQPEVQLERAVKFIKARTKKDSGWGKLVRDIEESGRSKNNGKLNVTKKQADTIRNIYDSLSGNGKREEQPEKEEPINDNEDIQKMAAALEEAAKKGDIPKEAFALAVITTVKKSKYRKVSDKQRRVIEEEYNKLSSKTAQESTEEIEASAEEDDGNNMVDIYSQLGEGLLCL